MRQTSLLIIFLVVFLDLVGFGIVLPVLPFYAQAFGATAWQLGWLVAVYALMQLLGAPVWARISDYTGRRPVLLLGLLGASVSLAVLGVAGSLQWLFIARILGGACGAQLATAHAYVADVTPANERTRGIGVIGAGYGLGFVFGPAIGGFLARYGYSVPIFAAAALNFANFVFTLWKLEEPKLAPEHRRENRGIWLDAESLRATLANPGLRLAIAVFFLSTLALSQMETVFVYYLGARFLYDAEAAGILLAVMGLIIVLVQGSLIGKFVRQYGEPKLVLAGTLLAAAGLALGVTVPSIYLAAPLFCLVAFAQGILRPSLSSLATLGAQLRKRGTAIALFYASGAVARSIGPLLAGWLYDRISWRTPFYWSSLIFVLAFVVALFWYSMHLRRQFTLDRVAAERG